MAPTPPRGFAAQEGSIIIYHRILFHRIFFHASSTAQGDGGSFKHRKSRGGELL